MKLDLKITNILFFTAHFTDLYYQSSLQHINMIKLWFNDQISIFFYSDFLLKYCKIQLYTLKNQNFPSNPLPFPEVPNSLTFPGLLAAMQDIA